MRTLKFLLEKEFRQIFRNKSLLPILFVLPMVQLLIMPLAANFDIKDIRVAIVDNDHSTYSRQLTEKIGASGYFHIEGLVSSYAEALRLVGTGSADIILEIPPQFARNLVKEGDQKLYMAADAINGMKGSLGASYLTAVLTDFNSEIRVEWMQPQKMEPQPTIEIVQENWFNPSMNYPFFMVPGILVILVTMVAGFIAALNIVQEKEIGTIEQINVTPIKKWQFILGKLVPFWLIGMIDFTIGLLIARLVYGIVPVGHIGTLYLFLSVYLVALLGFGLLVSTYSDNQLQAMFVAFFFIMIFILMSGLFTPVENMPGWAKVISHMTPVTYFIEVMRMIVLKGSDFGDIRTQFLIVLGFAMLLNGWAIFNYRKTS